MTAHARHARLLVVVASCALVAATAGCGDDDEPSPSATAAKAEAAKPGAVVERDRESNDPGIESIRRRIATYEAQGRLDRKDKNWRTAVPMRPVADPPLDSDRTYLWALHTSQGTIRIRLLHQKAPKHASNAIYLSLLGFYDGLTIHKAVPGVALEGGCPIGNGAGSPGYGFEPEYGDGDANAHSRRGLVVSTGIGGATDDCKFRILLAPDPADKLSTVFGEVVSGDDTLAKIEALGDEKGFTKVRVVLERAEIETR